MMEGPRWQNSLALTSQAGGNFDFFWPRVEAAEEGVRDEFTLRIVANAEGYEEPRHYFTVVLLPLLDAPVSPDSVQSVGFLYLFPE